MPFIAVMPRGTSAEKIDQITFYGGRCHFIDDPSTIYADARRMAAEHHGHFMDQFTFAERATDWRGNNNIAQSIFDQLAAERHPVPRWIVVGAGTGGTSATIGRFLRYQRLDTQLLVVDPERSAFLQGWQDDDPDHTTPTGSRIEGIGRQRVEPSLVPTVVDAMMAVPDAASIAAMRWTSRHLGRLVGGSTGTAMWGAVRLIRRMREQGERGSVVTLLCDGGERYQGTYYHDAWLATEGLDLAPYTAQLDAFLGSSPE